LFKTVNRQVPINQAKLTIFRKINCIILLFAFLLLQYARHISYLQCQAANYFAPSSPTCDCNKAFTEKSPADGSQPVPVHHHTHLEEYYCCTKAAGVVKNTNHLSLMRFAAYQCILPAGVKDEVIHPPQYY
jgi:hypothetical protein